MLYLQNEKGQSMVPTNQIGQGMAEYAVVLVLVSIVVIAALAIIGPSIGNVFSEIKCTLQSGGDVILQELCAAAGQ